MSLRQVDGSKDSLVKSRMLLRGVKKKIEDTTIDSSSAPKEVEQLEKLLNEVESKIEAL